MPTARLWSEQADATIRDMRASGQTWAAIGRSLGLSRNTVIERGRRLRATAPGKLARAATIRLVSDDPNRAALPAGHPLTWSLLTSEDFPPYQLVR